MSERPLDHNGDPIGMVHVYTGNGKGKTTAALGLALRALGADKRVHIIFFDKGGVHYSERHALDRLKPDLQYEAFGLTRMGQEEGGRFRFKNTEDDIEEARRAVNRARELVNSPHADLLVLDELITSIGTNLVTKGEVLDIIQARRPGLELVLTGRRCPEDFVNLADLVSEVNEVKHYFRRGVPAREGIDY
jgi:cob(I)alamin adenosyltransferase